MSLCVWVVFGSPGRASNAAFTTYTGIETAEFQETEE
jgi:hypothetical protein